jgi:glutamate racemase
VEGCGGNTQYATRMNRPIGVFDSGVGGLSVVRPLRALAPKEDIVYVADAAWCPYGPRAASVIRERAFQIAGSLVELRAKLIVVACNTASTAALAALRQRHPDIPFVGMEPAVKPAASMTQTGQVGVLATAATARGEALARLVDRFGRGLTVHVAVPEGLVELVEAGLGNSEAAAHLLGPVLKRWEVLGVDTVVLGCTHYPFAQPTIEHVVRPGVQIVDPSPAVARQVVRVLAAAGALRTGAERGRLRFLTSGDPEALRQTVGRLAPEVGEPGAIFEALETRPSPPAASLPRVASNISA